MRPAGANALAQALALYSSPHRLAEFRSRPLPDDVDRLLRVAGGETELASAVASACDCAPEHVREAAVFYLQQVLLDPAADAWRVLGVATGADADRLKRHHRLLVHWLHPDRNRDSWESVYVDRVNAAWNELRTPERRAAHVVPPTPAPAAVSPPLAVAAVLADDEPLPLSTRSVRKAPVLVLGSLGALGLFGLVLQYGLSGAAPEAEAATTSATAIAPRERAPAPPRAPARVVAPPPDVLVASLAPMPLAATAATEPAQVRATVAVPAPTPVVAPPAKVAAPPPAPTPVVAAGSPPPAPKAPVMAASTPPKPKTIAVAEATPPAPEAIEVAGSMPPARAPPPAATPPAQAAVAAPTVRAVPVAPMPVAAANLTVPAPTLATAQASTPAPAARPTSLDDAAARGLLRRFSEQFERGDAAGMRRLFVAEPGRELRGTLKDYERLFAHSVYRRIDITGVSWLPGADGATILGSYAANVVDPDAAQGRLERGVIRFDVREEAGEPRIYRLRQEILHD